MLVAALVLPIGRAAPAKAASNYYGTICILASNGRYLAPNNTYYLVAATDPYCDARSRMAVYRWEGMFAFRSSYGSLYTNPNVPCVWWCDDAGPILWPEGFYAVRCDPYARGRFFLYSYRQQRWAVLYPLPTGVDAPLFLWGGASLFYAHLGGGWCGA